MQMISQSADVTFLGSATEALWLIAAPQKHEICHIPDLQQYTEFDGCQCDCVFTWKNVTSSAPAPRVQPSKDSLFKLKVSMLDPYSLCLHLLVAVPPWRCSSKQLYKLTTEQRARQCDLSFSSLSTPQFAH